MVSKEMADLMHEPEADGRNIHVHDDVGVKIDMPLVVDGQGRQVDSLAFQLARLVHHDRVEGKEGAGEIGGLVGGPDPGCGPGSTWFGGKSFKG
jgi:hypothetical protein